MTDQHAAIQRLREALELAKEYPTLGQLKIDLRDVAALLDAHAALVDAISRCHEGGEYVDIEREELDEDDQEPTYEAFAVDRWEWEQLRGLATAAPQPAALVEEAEHG